MTTAPHEAERIDMSTVFRLLDDVRGIAEEMDGAKVDIQINNKSVMASKSRINKQLLYAAHLTDLARLEIMNQYHSFKGEDPPTIHA